MMRVPKRKTTQKKKAVKKTVRKTAKKAVKKKTARKAPKKTVKKVTKKTVKKAVPKKTVRKKVAPKKKTVKKAVKKTAVKKKAPVKAAKKTVKKKTPVKRAKKVAPKKTVKKTPVKKTVVKKTVKKASPKKAVKKSVVEKVTEPTTPKKEVVAVKKKARRKKKRGVMYFTADTERAIVEFNRSDNMSHRNKIYRERIKDAIEKLAENIFNTFKFTYFPEDPLVVQQQVVSFMVSNMHKYKAPEDGGSKAFSYFSVVAKNWLILQNNGNWKRWNQHTEILDAPDEETSGEILIHNDNVNQEISEFADLMVEYWDANLTTIFTKRKELEIANAVVELFKNRQAIENFNKKTLYLYIREMSGCKTQNITKVINKMKDNQREITRQYLSHGTVQITPESEEEDEDSFFTNEYPDSLY